MKILAVNKFYYIKGGAESYFFSLNDLCTKKGHEIIPFSMKDEKNLYSEYERYFINNISYKNMNLKTKITNATKIVYSFEAKKKIKNIIRDTCPDLAHLHIFQHQMSPSIIHCLKKLDIPIVNTVHDLKVICPNYKMLNRNGICEKCKGHNYYNCFMNSCTKGSKLFSAVNVVEAYLHNYLKSYSYVDKYICPSEFYKKKFIEFGIPKEKVEYIPNFVDINQFEPCYEDKGYFAYVGRLSEEKGIETLIKSMKNVQASKLYIIGTGPMEVNLKKQVEDMNLNNVEFLGYKSGKDLKDLIKNSKFTIIPSEWYENCPMSVIEAMAYGKPVIGSDLGGIPELIEDGITGLIFKAKNEEDLAYKINYMINNDNKCKQMGVAARQKVENEYDKDIHYARVNEVYKKLLKNR